MHKQFILTTVTLLSFCLLACKKNGQAPLLPVQTIQYIGTGELKEGRVYAAATAVGDKIYIFGGKTTNLRYTNTIEEFDTKTNTSITLADTLTDSKAFLTATAIGDKIYIFGGQGKLERTSNKIEIFDTKTKTISVLSDTLKERLDALSSVAIGNSIYIFGGRITRSGNTGYTISKKIEVLDTKTNKVSMLSQTLTKERHFMSAAIIGDNIYLFGGVHDELGINGIENDIEIFNTNTKAASILSDSLSQNKCATSAAVVEDKIFVFGGEFFKPRPYTEYQYNTIEMLDTKTQKVDTLPLKLKNVKTGTCAVTVGNKIYVFGGYDDKPGVFKTIEIFEAIRGNQV
ncbi:MAG TPA: kelch repeat-containing protein, partial [Chitinophagaceae bacterium]|nr:kelch repeat-containing protein [Chitinophagaceae bacterium]